MLNIEQQISYFDSKAKKCRKKAASRKSIIKIKSMSKKIDFPKPSGRTVLFWKGVGGSKKIIRYEIKYAQYLMSKGVNVVFVLCDGCVSGCIKRTIFDDNKNESSMDNWYKQCSCCYYEGETWLKAARIPFRRMSDWISFDTRKEIRKFADIIDIDKIETYESYGDVPTGDIAITGALRYFRSKYRCRNLNENCDSYLKKIVREYFYSSMICEEAARNAIDEIKPDNMFMLRGVYPMWGPPAYVAKNRGIPVTFWSYAYNPNSAYMRTSTKNDFDQFHSPQKEYWETIKHKKLDNIENCQLDRLMTNRINALSSGCQSFGKEFPSVKKLKSIFEIPYGKKVWMINSHCNWDWDTYKENKVFFDDPIEWLIHTFSVVKENNNLIWLLRTHPAENSKNTITGCKEILLREFGSIPDHIKVITSESQINTYSLFPLIDGCVTMQSTVGIEMALYGNSVLLGDHGFYGNRGFTINPNTIEDYDEALRRIHLSPIMTNEQIEMAKRYAYDFWFIRQIPFRSKKYQEDIKNNPLFEAIYDGMINNTQILWEKDLEDCDLNKDYNWRDKLNNGWK